MIFEPTIGATYFFAQHVGFTASTGLTLYRLRINTFRRLSSFDEVGSMERAEHWCGLRSVSKTRSRASSVGARHIMRVVLGILAS